MRGFAFPRKNAGEAADLAASLEANNRELVAWLNSATVRFDTDGTVTLPGNLNVAGDITDGGVAVSVATHTHTQPVLIGAKVYAGAVTSIADSTDTTVLYDSEVFDSSGFHSVSTNTGRLTVPTGMAGYYLIGATFSVASNATGIRTGAIRYNAAAKLVEVNRSALSGGGTVWAGQTVAYLGVGDYVTSEIWQNSTASLDNLTSAVYSQFWLLRVGV